MQTKSENVSPAPVVQAVPAIPTIKRKGKKPGRKPKTKSARIRELTRAGFTPRMIAAKVGSPIDYVYTVRSDFFKKENAYSQSLVPKKSGGGARKAKPVLPFTPVPAKLEGTLVPYDPLYVATAAPRATLWQRIKAVFTG